MSDARIHRLGYRTYDGPRLGVRHAVLSTARHAFRSLLGIRRGIFAKLVTIAVAALAYLPALVFLGLSVLIPRQLIEAGLPGPSDYLGFVTTSVLLFVSLGAPVVLCPDRRHGTIALYLASPLNRDTYLLGRAMAIAGFLAIVTMGPPILLLIGLEMLGEGAGSILGFASQALRAIGAGAAMGLTLTAISLAISSITDRHASASAFTILFLFGSSVISGILIGGLDLSPTIGLGNVVFVALEAALRFNGDQGPLEDVSTVVVALAWLAWTVGGAAFVRWRYRHVEVTR